MRHIFAMDGKVAIVTGGSGSLGSEVVKGLAAFGATVVVADLAERPDAEREGGRRFFLPCDVSKTESIREMMRETKRRFGKIDILINCAAYGAGYGPQGTVDQMSDEDWEKGVDGAVGTTFRCTREVIPYMVENGGGTIVNIASMYGMVSPDPRIYGTSGANNPANYGVGKAGVIQFTRYCAAHYARHNIRVNSISPGPFPNPKIQQDQDFVEQLNAKTMLNRVGQPHEIAGAVILLASPASSYITGANIPIDGGWTAW